MKIALTGATGFIGRYIARQLVVDGNELKCWHRTSSDRSGLDEIDSSIEWIEGELGNGEESRFVSDCDAVVHSALYHPGGGFQGGEGNVIDFVQTNVVGTLKLIEAAKQTNVGRFIFISTCAVHDEILDDRPLDETHPLWMKSHYGAHKAANEKFVHSYGLGSGFPICALRPTGVYGVAHPVENSKWHGLIGSLLKGEEVVCRKGGKEVHAADVAKATSVLLKANADRVTGQAFNCYDRYISQWDVAQVVKDIVGDDLKIAGEQASPKHQIETAKLRNLGMQFGGSELLQRTIRDLVDSIQAR